MAPITESTPLRGGAAVAAKRQLFLRRVAFVALATAVLAGLLYIFHSPDAQTTTTTPATATTGVNADWFCGERDFEADYIKLRNKHDDHYFYWFARSRNSSSAHSDPLVVWLNGGPGASSLEGLLVENGPCLVQPDLSMKRNDFAWNNNANVIWLEQPSGVGFSYFTDDADRDATGKYVGANMYAFLDGFLDKHPEFVGRALYLTGESYAGHYIPAAAYYIWKENKKQTPQELSKRINLQGVAIGNGDPNLVLQYKYSVEMATTNNYNLTLLTDAQIAQMKIDSDVCATLLANCQPHSNDTATGCLAVSASCDAKMLSPYLAAGRNFYDIRQPCSTAQQCSDTDGGVVERFLNSDVVRTALASVLQGREWGRSGGYVNSAFLNSVDWAKTYEKEIAELLNDGLRMLIYAGDADLVCNWLGNRAWTLALEWKGAHGYRAAPESAFSVPMDPLALNQSQNQSESANTVVAGSKWHFDNLAFVRVADAGHLVPMNQPLASWVMIDRFLSHQEL